MIYHYSCSFYHGVELLADAATLIGLRPIEITERMKKIREEIEATRKLQKETFIEVDGIRTVKEGVGDEYNQLQQTIFIFSQQLNTLSLRLMTTKFK
jgi:hypothetical protein